MLCWFTYLLVLKFDSARSASEAPPLHYIVTVIVNIISEYYCRPFVLLCIRD